MWMESVNPAGVTHMIVTLKSRAVSFIEKMGQTEGIKGGILYDRYYLL